MCDTKEELYKKIINTYKEPLIWYFDYYRNNITVMYGENEEPQITFIILYKNNNKYFIDFGYTYRHGDNDGYGYYDFGYNYKIKETIELENKIYETLYTEISGYFGSVFIEYYIIKKDDFDSDDTDYNEYIIIKKDDNVIIYKLENDNIFFINNTEKNNYVNSFIEYIDN